MTNVEDELRAALMLLEQRAPQMTPDSVLGPAATRGPGSRRWFAPLVAAVAVLGVVLVAVIIKVDGHSGRHAPAASRGSATTMHRSNPGTTTCLEKARYRSGAGTTLVPGSPTSVTICQYPSRRPSVVTIASPGTLVATLNALPTSPISPHCHARYPGALPARGTYELHFHYATGPDVVVNVGPECRPSVNNSTSLQADDAATVVTVLQQVIPPQDDVQYRALAIRTGCVGARCREVPPKALASRVHATACTAWQLNPGSHGGPAYLTRLLVPTDLAEQDRTQIAGLPGVVNIDLVPAADIAQTPPTQRNFRPPTPTECA